MKKQLVCKTLLASLTLATLFGCGDDSSNYTSTEAKPGKPVIASTALQAAFSYPNATITSVTLVPEGTVENSLKYSEHCKVIGKLNERVSPVDGKTYAIGFEMRLPTNWNGRYFYQANGGLDGSLPSAYGTLPLSGGLTSNANALQRGFAVITTNAGHAMESGTIGGGVFGIDPQARLDYGYNAVAATTPMAKSLIKTYYGKYPDKSYIAGGSNGGRHTMVAASRLGDQYDGFLPTAPGFNLPKAAVAQIWGVQQYAAIATTLGTSSARLGRPDISSVLSLADVQLVANKIIAKCDALDGVADNSVNNLSACQSAFNIFYDVPTCTGAPDGTCLTYGQKSVLAKVHAGAKNSAGESLYTNFLWSEGIGTSGWRTWKFDASTGNRDPLSIAFVFMTPPVSPTVLDGTGTTLYDYALNYNNTGFNYDTDAPKIYTTNSTYTESAMSFMTPPDLMMKKMVANHAKMLVIHGAGDPVFSVQDTINWYKNFSDNYGTGATTNMLRLYIVPGMGHVSGGRSTDQSPDPMDALVNWVEKGIVPGSMTATARGVGTTSPNADVPTSWSATRTRPLCPYPTYAKYNGTGNIEDAVNFSCVAP